MKNSITIGRDNSNDIIINEPRVSRKHAIITILDDGSCEIKDLGSTNRTYLNGKVITREIIKPGDKLRVASSIVDWKAAFQNLVQVKNETITNEEPVTEIKKTITIGSSKDNDLRLTNSYVSSHHASISLLKNGNFYLRDMGSRNGSFINDKKVGGKNFTKTDVVKIAGVDLPATWIELFTSRSRKLTASSKTFALPTMGGLTFVDMANIIYCEGASNQTKVYLEGNKKELVSRTLKECEDLLSQPDFIRIHKSYLVNLNFIKKYISGKDGQVILNNGTTLTVSRNYKNEFLDRFGRR